MGKTRTGLDYYGARYYDPAAGTFTSADSVLPGKGYSPAGLNRYAYVAGNPETLTDPNGHAPGGGRRCLDDEYCQTNTGSGSGSGGCQNDTQCGAGDGSGGGNGSNVEKAKRPPDGLPCNPGTMCSSNKPGAEGLLYKEGYDTTDIYAVDKGGVDQMIGLLDSLKTDITTEFQNFLLVLGGISIGAGLVGNLAKILAKCVACGAIVVGLVIHAWKVYSDTMQNISDVRTQLTGFESRLPDNLSGHFIVDLHEEPLKDPFQMQPLPGTPAPFGDQTYAWGTLSVTLPDVVTGSWQKAGS